VLPQSRTRTPSTPPGRAAPASAGARRPGDADAAAPDAQTRRRTFRRQSAARRCFRLRSSGFAPSPRGERLCRRDHVRRRVDADRLARRHALRKTGSDGAGPAADVEQAHPGLQERQEEHGSRFHRPSRVTSDDRRMVAELIGLAGGHGARHWSPWVRRAHSGRTPASRATSRQSAISFLIVARNCSGVPPAGDEPSA